MVWFGLLLNLIWFGQVQLYRIYYRFSCIWFCFFFSVDFDSVWLSWIWFGLVWLSIFVKVWFGLLCFGLFEFKILHSKGHGQTCTKIETYKKEKKKKKRKQDDI